MYLLLKLAIDNILIKAGLTTFERGTRIGIGGGGGKIKIKGIHFYKNIPSKWQKITKHSILLDVTCKKKFSSSAIKNACKILL